MTDQPPTELARPIDATEASLAWAFDESPEVVAYRPRWITRAAVASALVLIAGAGAVALLQVRESPAPAPVAASATTTVTVEADEPQPTSAPVTTPAPTPTTTKPRKPAVPGDWGQGVPVETAGMRVPPPPPPVAEEVPVGTPDPRDPQFIANLLAKGWWISDQPLILLRAHQVCGALQDGISPSNVSANAVATWAITPQEAMMLVATVRETYPNCP